MKFVEDETPGWGDDSLAASMEDAELAQANEDALYGDESDAPIPPPPGMEDLTDEQRASYEATVANAKAAFETLQKIEAAAVAWNDPEVDAVSIRIKPEDCYVLMGWIVNLQNIGDLLSTQIQAAQDVIQSQADALAKYEEATGKKLWTPGPVGR